MTDQQKLHELLLKVEKIQKKMDDNQNRQHQQNFSSQLRIVNDLAILRFTVNKICLHLGMADETFWKMYRESEAQLGRAFAEKSYGEDNETV